MAATPAFGTQQPTVGPRRTLAMGKIRLKSHNRKAREEDSLGQDDGTAFKATPGEEWSSALHESVILLTLECWLLYWRVGVSPSISSRVQGMK